MRKSSTQIHYPTTQYKNLASRDLILESDASGISSSQSTVLVIDDDPAVSRLIERSLEGDAQVLQLFELPDEGELDLSGIDLIILDYILPSRDGLMLLEEIREIDQDVPVIFITGHGDGELAKRAIDKGANEYLAKPFEPVLLRRLVRRLGSGGGDELEGTTGQAAEPNRSARVFHAVASNGESFEGVLRGFDAGSAVVEVEEGNLFRVGDMISNADVIFGSSKIDFSTGKVERVISNGDNDEVTFGLSQEWLVADRDSEGFEGAFQCYHSEEGERDREALPGNLRLAALDLASVFREIQDDVVSFELSLDKYSPRERVKVEGDFLHYAKGTMYERLTNAVVQFEEASIIACSMGFEKPFKSFSRKLLYPHVLSSPFMSRIVERPIGVPGDFDMLGQILGKRFRGGSLFGRLINEWILSNPATDAYRHRVQLLEDQTRQVIEKKFEGGETASVLSMASGVAYEVQRYVQNSMTGRGVEFTLVDFSEDTLAEAKSQFKKLGQCPDEVKVNFEQSSVIELANSSRSGVIVEGGWVPESQYDVVYCAGLFDYLSDRMIVSVTRYLNTLVADGGVLVVSNYTTHNPFAHFMGLVLDWELIYRSENHFEGLMQKALGEGNFDLTTDKHGVEVYAIANS